MILKQKKESALRITNPFYSKAEEDADFNFAPLGVAYSKKNAGVNFGGLLGVVGENAGVNVSLVYADVGGSQDYTIEDVLPRLTRYLPKFIREISFPAINFGTVTNTKNPRNSFALGVYNRVDATNGKDYISVGLLNRVITPDGHGKKRVSHIPFLAGKVSIDGIFRHRKQTQENKDDTKQRHNK